MKGYALPNLTIQGKNKQSGELHQTGDEIKYIDWGLLDWDRYKNTDYIFTILYLPAIKDTDKNTKTFVDALKNNTHKISKKHLSINILNTGAIPWYVKFIGGPIAVSRFEEEFKKKCQSVFIIDDNSKAKASWDLKENETAIILLNADRKVVFFKIGREGEVLLDVEESKKYIETLLDILHE